MLCENHLSGTRERESWYAKKSFEKARGNAEREEEMKECGHASREGPAGTRAQLWVLLYCTCLAWLSDSRRRTPAPSPITNPSLSRQGWRHYDHRANPRVGHNSQASAAGHKLPRKKCFYAKIWLKLTTTPIQTTHNNPKKNQKIDKNSNKTITLQFFNTKGDHNHRNTPTTTTYHIYRAQPPIAIGHSCLMVQYASCLCQMAGRLWTECCWILWKEPLIKNTTIRKKTLKKKLIKNSTLNFKSILHTNYRYC